MRWWSLICSICVFVALPVFVRADISPEGRWKIVRDKSHQPVAIIKVFQQNGEFRGMIDEILSESAGKPSPRCQNCPGSLKGQPIEGLVIMQGLKREGDQFGGGHILDPDTGNYYRLKMSLGPDGKTLLVRGYLGVSLLGRTQTWYRVD